MADGNASRTCVACGRTVRHVSRGMCPKCYHVWKRDNLPPNHTCLVCGRRYYRPPGTLETAKACSRECWIEWRRGKNPRNEPAIRTQPIERPCAWCDRPFTTNLSVLDRGGGLYCSRECYWADKPGHHVVQTCEWCKKTFQLPPKRLFHTRGRFCSRDCFHAAQQATKLPVERSRGEAYRRFRKAWIDRVGRCERCGTTQNLRLHHRTRVRERPDLLYEPTNLEVLCTSCHTWHHATNGHTSVPELHR